METLEIQKSNAIKAFNSADEKGKALLVNLFGENNLSQKICDRLNGFDDIIAIAGVDAKDYELRPGETADELAYRKWKLIALVYNEGRLMDAKNKNQYKYYPWARIDASSGCGLSLRGVDFWNSTTNVGVRLCFEKEADAKDAFNKFSDIYAAMQIN
jgi:hypothetical protein